MLKALTVTLLGCLVVTKATDEVKQIMTNEWLRDFLDIVGNAVGGNAEAGDKWIDQFTPDSRVSGFAPECKSFVKGCL